MLMDHTSFAPAPLKEGLNPDPMTGLMVGAAISVVLWALIAVGVFLAL